MTHRTAASIAWGSFGVSIVFVVLMAIVAPIVGVEDDPESGPLIVQIGTMLAVLAFSTVGALVASRQPSNAIGWMFCAFGAASLGVFNAETWWTVSAGPTDALAPRLAGWLANVVGGPVVLVFLAFLLLLFPDGRSSSTRWRRLAWVAGACNGLYLLIWALAPGDLVNVPAEGLEKPFGVRALGGIARVVYGPAWAILPATVILAAASLVIRFRRSRGVERQQIKWFALSGLVLAIAFVLGPAYGWRESSPAFAWPLTFFLAILSVPVAAGIAILRYRLYDIDRIISRTATYAILIALLGAIYAGLVIGLGRLIEPLTGGSDLVVALSTLVVAALFRPLLRRVQAVIERRFNRSRYNAARTIDAFTVRLRQHVDLDALVLELESVVDRTMQPQHLFLWVAGGK